MYESTPSFAYVRKHDAPGVTQQRCWSHAAPSAWQPWAAPATGMRVVPCGPSSPYESETVAKMPELVTGGGSGGGCTGGGEGTADGGGGGGGGGDGGVCGGG